MPVAYISSVVLVLRRCLNALVSSSHISLTCLQQNTLLLSVQNWQTLLETPTKLKKAVKWQRGNVRFSPAQSSFLDLLLKLDPACFLLPRPLLVVAETQLVELHKHLQQETQGETQCETQHETRHKIHSIKLTTPHWMGMSVNDLYIHFNKTPSYTARSNGAFTGTHHAGMVRLNWAGYG